MRDIRFLSIRNVLTIDDAIAERIIHTEDLPKRKDTYDILLPVTGKTSLVTIPTDAYWRKLRKMFNPGFSTGHLETSIPGIVEESMVFVKMLEEAAQSGSIIPLGDKLQVTP